MPRTASSTRQALQQASSPPQGRLERFIPAFLIIAIFATYCPLLTSEFSTFDDNQTIVANPWLNPPKWESLEQFWNPRKPVMDIYIPLTYSLWAGVAALSYVPVPDPTTGAYLNPWIFHGANIVVHCIAALLAFAILRRLTKSSWASAAGAALFALHPVQVEPVAWISGMKDVLAGCMGLLAIWQYIAFADSEESQTPSSRRWLSYALAILAFICAMLTKPSAVVVPLLAGAIDVGLLKRSWQQMIISLAPWLALTVPIILEGHFAQPASQLGYITPIHLRPLIALDALGYYLYKLVLPIWHSIVYDRTPQSVLRHGWLYFTWIAPVAVALGAWLYRKRFPALLTGIAIYWLAVLPVLGLVPFDFQDHSTVADHYLYLAMLGPAIIAAFALARARGRAVIGSCIIAIIVMASWSFIQTLPWHDSMSLYRHALAVNPHGWVPRNNLAVLEDNAGHHTLALQLLQQAQQDVPPSVGDRAAQLESLGDVYAHMGQYQQALSEYEQIEAISPGNAVIGRKILAMRARTGAPSRR